jgi:hypothetical protein
MKLRNCTVGSPDYPRLSGADGKLFLPSSFASSLFAVAAYLTHADKLIKKDHHNDHHDSRQRESSNSGAISQSAWRNVARVSVVHGECIIGI